MEWYFILMWIVVGMIIAIVLLSMLSVSGRSDVESEIAFWRHSCLLERDSHRGTQKQLDEIKLRCIEKGVVLWTITYIQY